MKVQQIINFVKQNMNFAQNQNKPDLTSFGAQQQADTNSTQLISKDAAEALKSKYMSNVSFEGNAKTVLVKNIGHYESQKARKYYGTNGEYYELDYMEDVYYNDGYQANISESDSSSGLCKTFNTAVECAIRNSNAYQYGSRIYKSDIPNFNKLDKNTYVGGVYFSDPGEKVPNYIKRVYKYIVYAPGAKDAEERVHKKSFWEKLWS